MRLIYGKKAGIISLTRLGMLFLIAATLFAGHVTSFAQDSTTGIELSIVGDLDLYPVLPKRGDSVVIGVLVTNGGKKDARDVPVYFYEDSVYFEKVTVDIRAGDTVYVEANWTADSGDTYISIIVDPERVLPENRREIRVGAWVTVR